MILVAFILISIIIVYYYSTSKQVPTYAQELLYSNATVESGDRYVNDSNFAVETVAHWTENSNRYGISFSQ